MVGTIRQRIWGSGRSNRSLPVATTAAIAILKGQILIINKENIIYIYIHISKFKMLLCMVDVKGSVFTTIFITQNTSKDTLRILTPLVFFSNLSFLLRSEIILNVEEFTDFFRLFALNH